MHFVDNVDLVARLDWRIPHPFEELAHLVDLGATGGIQLQHVDMPAVDNAAVVVALDREIHRRLVNRIGLIVQSAG